MSLGLIEINLGKVRRRVVGWRQHLNELVILMHFAVSDIDLNHTSELTQFRGNRK